MLIILALLILLILFNSKCLEGYDKDIYPNYRWDIHRCLDNKCLIKFANRCTQWCTEQPPNIVDENECIYKCKYMADLYSKELPQNITIKNQWYNFGQFIC